MLQYKITLQTTLYWIQVTDSILCLPCLYGIPGMSCAHHGICGDGGQRSGGQGGRGGTGGGGGCGGVTGGEWIGTRGGLMFM